MVILFEEQEILPLQCCVVLSFLPSDVADAVLKCSVHAALARVRVQFSSGAGALYRTRGQQRDDSDRLPLRSFSLAIYGVKSILSITSSRSKKTGSCRSGRFTGCKQTSQLAMRFQDALSCFPTLSRKRLPITTTSQSTETIFLSSARAAVSSASPVPPRHCHLFAREPGHRRHTHYLRRMLARL